LWSMTKKGQQKFWRMKIEKFFGKRYNFRQSLIFFKIGGKSETGEENASWPQGDGRPCLDEVVGGDNLMTHFP